LTRHPSIPLAGFLDAGGDPTERIPADRLRALALDVAHWWNPAYTAYQRGDRARHALASYNDKWDDAHGSDQPPVVDPDGREVDEIVAVWSADMLRNGELFLTFVATLPTRLRSEVSETVMHSR